MGEHERATVRRNSSGRRYPHSDGVWCVPLRWYVDGVLDEFGPDVLGRPEPGPTGPFAAFLRVGWGVRGQALVEPPSSGEPHADRVHGQPVPVDAEPEEVLVALVRARRVQLVAVDLPVVGNPQIHSDHEWAEQGADGPAEDGAHPRVRGSDSADVKEQVDD